MEASYKDPKTGEIKKYEISYSQELQQQMIDELKKSNRLKWILLIAFILVIITGALVWLNTGTVGEVLRRGICP